MVVFFFKQKTAYEMRISDWSSDVCSSDLVERIVDAAEAEALRRLGIEGDAVGDIVAEQQERRETGRRGLDAGVVDVGEQAARHEAPALIQGIIAPADSIGAATGDIVEYPITGERTVGTEQVISSDN